MRITESRLRQIIREEARDLREARGPTTDQMRRHFKNWAYDKARTDTEAKFAADMSAIIGTYHSDKYISSSDLMRLSRRADTIIPDREKRSELITRIKYDLDNF
jgi:hypothetical protein